MLVLFVVNLTNVMAEFAGVAASLEIFAISKYISVPLAAAFVWFLVLKGSYKSVEKIFLFACVFYLAYIISGFLAKPDWGHVLKETVQPRVDWDLPYIVMLVGLVGTAIARCMQFYLQSSIVEKGVSVEDYGHLRLDVVVGCVIAPVVAFFIVVACASAFYVNGISIQTAKDAALALEPVAGAYASILFAFGLFIASIFAASVLPLSTAYSICEGLGWDAGVDKRFDEAPQFFILYALMIGLGAAVVLLPNFPLLTIMFISQVGNGILLPVILIAMLFLINDENLMGEFRNPVWLNVVTVMTVAVIVALNGLLVWLTVSNPEIAVNF
jgi:Mn2+/Fe2+ NRAMP family transporter